MKLRLTRTLFHPQGGGQPADKGTLNNISVLHVMQQQERIFHFTETPLPLGSQILMKLDKDLRYCHSAGHLIGYLVENCDWQPLKAHHWPNEARIIFKPLGEVKIPDKVILQKELSYWVSSDLPRWQKQEGGKRQVGFGDLFFHHCGGTHVSSLGKIRELILGDIKFKKGNLVISYQLT